MVFVIGVLLAFVLLALGVTMVRGRSSHVHDMELEPAPAVTSSTLVKDHPLMPWFVGAGTILAIVLSIPTPVWVAVAIGGVAGVICSIVLHFLAMRRLARFEFQLADGIDLMVSTLRAGGGLTDALVGAARETRRPLRPFLQEIVERVRIGESPEGVLANLEERVPLETFRLFTFTLAAHWQGGGSLATTLSNVGRTIRDRVDVSRRVTSQAIETQVSVVFVIVVTYGLAFFMWHNYPDRMQLFAESEFGAMLMGTAILLQGIGLLWIARMTRIEV